MTRIMGSLLVVAAAGVLLGVLVVLTGLDLGALWARLRGIPLWLLGAFTALTVVQIGLSALKWRAVIEVILPEGQPRPAFRFYAASSAASAALSQVLTTYMASIVVRAWAVKRFHNMSLKAGAASSVLEQVFDVVVLLAMLAVTLLVWGIGGGVGMWLGALVLAGLAGGVLCRGLSGGGRMALARLHPRFRPLAETPAGSGLWEAGFLRRLYGLSVLRYLVMLVRAPLLVVALGFPITALDAAQGFTLVQGTQLAALTPGNLGLQEWGWTGVLFWQGYGAEAGLEFALVLRVIGLVSLIAAAALILMVCLRAERRGAA